MTDVKIVALVVTRNEADRYLEPCLRRLAAIADEVVVYDDQSEDRTVAVALETFAKVAVRPDDVPAFADHEGRFREAAWRWAETAAGPRPGDLFVVVDADEMFLAPAKTVRAQLEALPAEHPLADAWDLPIVECFGVTDGRLLSRIDGDWGRIRGARVARWEPDHRFADVVLGCGAIPVTLHQRVRMHAPELVHLGYLRPEDRAAKHQRYRANRGRHKSRHIESIVATPTLVATGWTLEDAP